MIATKCDLNHVQYVADNMRQSDIDELAKLGKTPLQALTEGLNSTECFTLLVNEQPIMIFGMEESGLDSAVIWALGTDDVFKHRREFLRQSVKWRDSFLKDYSILFNHVDINIFDDEIIRITKSKGILGLQLDERRIASKKAIRSSRIYFPTKKNRLKNVK